METKKRSMRQTTLWGTDPVVAEEQKPKKQKRPIGPELTEQQQRITAHVPGENQFVIIEAYAGTGKTSTFRAVAKAHREHRFLYVVFNKNMAEEALTRFKGIGNVTVMTTYSLAYKFTHSEFGKVDVVPYASMLEPRPSSAVCSTLKRFWESDDEKVLEKHVSRSVPAGHRAAVAESADKVWKRMQMRDVPFTHQAYLKYFASSKNAINWLESKYNVVLLDEAQDSELILMQLFMKLRRATFYLVGDSCQNIYTFKHSVNAMKVAREYAAKNKEIELHSFHLTRSFRFGNNVAVLCTELLAKHKLIGPPLSGRAFTTTILGQHNSEGAILRLVQRFPSPAPAMVSRTNAGAVQAALQLLQHSPTARPLLMGNMLAHLVEFLKRADQHEYGPQAYLEQQIQRAIEYEDEAEEATLRFIKSFGLAELRSAVHRLGQAKPKDNEEPTACFGTVHGFKGLEYDTVLIGEDFGKLEEMEDPEDVRILYVALSRVRNRLVLSPDLSQIMAKHVNQGFFF